MPEERIYDCIIVGAGPGGLQAAIYLGRYNRDVLLIDRTGGRTQHAKHIENFLSHALITGEEIIARGKEQAESFNVAVERGQVISIAKKGAFAVSTHTATRLSRFVIVSSGVYDIFPDIENTFRFLGTSLFTCIDCDGYRTTGKKLVILGDDMEGVSHAFAMKDMYTNDITLILTTYTIPPEFEEALKEENISFIPGKPVRLAGARELEAVELEDGRKVACEVVMATYGYRRNDGFLSALELQRDSSGFIVTNRNYESSVSGLYVVGPLNTGNDQVVIAAGEGAVAAIDLNKRLVERRIKSPAPRNLPV